MEVDLLDERERSAAMRKRVAAMRKRVAALEHEVRQLKAHEFPLDEEKVGLHRYVSELRAQVSLLESRQMSEPEELWHLRLNEANKVIDQLQGKTTALKEQTQRDWGMRRAEVTKRVSDAFLDLSLTLSLLIPTGTLSQSAEVAVRDALRRAQGECDGSRTRPAPPPVDADSDGGDRRPRDPRRG